MEGTKRDQTSQQPETLFTTWVIGTQQNSWNPVNSNCSRKQSHCCAEYFLSQWASGTLMIVSAANAWKAFTTGCTIPQTLTTGLMMMMMKKRSSAWINSSNMQFVLTRQYLFKMASVAGSTGIPCTVFTTLCRALLSMWHPWHTRMRYTLWQWPPQHTCTWHLDLP